MPILDTIAHPFTHAALPSPWASSVAVDIDPHQGFETDSTGRGVQVHSSAGAERLVHTSGHASQGLRQVRRFEARDHVAAVKDGYLAGAAQIETPKITGPFAALVVVSGLINTYAHGFDAAEGSPQPFSFYVAMPAVGHLQLLAPTLGEIAVAKTNLWGESLQRASRVAPFVLVYGSEPGSGFLRATHSQLAVVEDYPFDYFIQNDRSGAVPNVQPNVTLPMHQGYLLRWLMFTPGVMPAPEDFAALRDWATETYLGYGLGYKEMSPVILPP